MADFVFDQPLLHEKRQRRQEKATPKARRTPVFAPHRLMKTPPKTGPKAMGRRRTKECMDTPMVLFSGGKTLATRLMVAGREMAVQERNKTAPI